MRDITNKIGFLKASNDITIGMKSRKIKQAYAKKRRILTLREVILTLIFLAFGKNAK